MSKFLAALQKQEEQQPEEQPAPVAEQPIEEAEEKEGKGKGKKKKKKDAEEKKDQDKPAPKETIEEKPDPKPKAEANPATAAPEAEEEEGPEDDKNAKPGAPSKKKDKKKPISAAGKMLAEKMQKKKEEEERIKRELEEIKRKEEEEKRRIEEEERLRKEEEDRIAAEKAAIKQQKINDGTYLSKADKKKKQAQERARQQLLMTMQSYGTNIGLKAPAEDESEVPDPAQPKPVEKVERKQSKAQKEAEVPVPNETPLTEVPAKKKSEVIEQPKASRKHSTKSNQNQTAAANQPTEEMDDWEKMVDMDKYNETISSKTGQQQEAKNTQHTKSKPAKHKKNQAKEDASQGQTEEVMTEKMPEGGDDFGGGAEEVIYSSENEAFYVKSKFRCPIICILGHVDTGKTKILDKIRRTNVQNNEEGGITQQIGASFFPQYKLKEEISKLEKAYKKIDVEIPGLLIIDTPGHESFGNLRKRGESMCDFAILVVDVKHSLENQTIESLKMLQEKGTPFIVAFNKIDIINGWQSTPDSSSYESLKKQQGFTQALYDEYFNRAQQDFAQHGILIQNYWENPDPQNNQSVIPTSAFTGEGIPDLLGYITEYCQTVLEEKITPKQDFNCTVMEVKKIDGLGTTIDVVLVDGQLKEGDKIVLSGFEGPVETTIRALLTPQPLKELRVKADYIHHKVLKGAMGCKIAAPGLEKAIAGSSMYRYETEEELEAYRENLLEDMDRVRKMVKFKSEGVAVIASTLGSLEALLVFLKTEKIPVSHVSIGDISKEDVMKAQTALLVDDDRKRRREYGTILAFDVKSLQDVDTYAKKVGVRIIHAKIIYHLCDEYKKWVQECLNERKEQQKKDAVFPCVLKTIAFFNKKDPIVLGCDVVEGVLKLKTPICVFKGSEKIVLGLVESIESNHKAISEARINTGNVAVKIKALSDKTNYTAGRTFEESDSLYANISRRTIDCLKENFRDEMTDADWDLIRKLKSQFGITN